MRKWLSYILVFALISQHIMPAAAMTRDEDDNNKGKGEIPVVTATSVPQINPTNNNSSSLIPPFLEQPFAKALSAFKELKTSHPDLKGLSDTKPTCFISYAWGVPEQEKLVHTLASHLKEGGINVLLDIWHNTGGTSTLGFAQRILDPQTDFVVLCGSKMLMRKLDDQNDRNSVVRVEVLDLLAQRMTWPRIKRNILPILLEGRHEEVLPLFLGNTVSIGFQKREDYPFNYLSLLKELYKLKKGDTLAEPIINGLRAHAPSLTPFILQTPHVSLQIASSSTTSQNDEENKVSISAPTHKTRRALEAAAKADNRQAAYDLAMLYWEGGEDTIKDITQALTWLEKAAEPGQELDDLGSFEAQLKLASLYLYGAEEVEKDYSKAKKWLQGAIEHKDHPKIAEAYFTLAQMYEKGWGVKQGEKEAFKWYQRAADQGYMPAIRKALGLRSSNEEINGDGEQDKPRHGEERSPLFNAPPAQNETKTAEWYSKAAQKGYASAQNSLGIFYEEKSKERAINKKDRLKYTRTAIEWYNKAAKQGLTEAQYNLAIFLAKLLQVDPEKKLKDEPEEKRAARNEKFANTRSWAEQARYQKLIKLIKHFTKLKPLEMSLDHLDEENRNKTSRHSSSNNTSETTRIKNKVIKKAEQGNPVYQYQLAQLYEVEHDQDRALEWYVKAMEGGSFQATIYLDKQRDANTFYKIGNIYEYKEFDSNKAVLWLTKAAKQGHTEALFFLEGMAQHDFMEAQYTLGKLYREGGGVKRDYVKSAFWLSKVAQQAGGLSSLEARAFYDLQELAKEDYEEGLSALKTLAEQGLLQAQYILAGIYQQGGVNIEPDLDKAAYWFAKAAQQEGGPFSLEAMAIYKLKEITKQGINDSKKTLIDLRKDKGERLFSFYQHRVISYKEIADKEDLFPINASSYTINNNSSIFRKDVGEASYITDLSPIISGNYVTNAFTGEYIDKAISEKGSIITDDDAIQIDDTKIIKWLIRASTNGVPLASYQLAKIFKMAGYHTLSLNYLEKAARKGHIQAAYKMSRYLAKHSSSGHWQKDYGFFLKIAAEGGYPKAYEYDCNLTLIAGSIEEVGDPDPEKGSIKLPAILKLPTIPLKFFQE